jgi:YVTN family beta-propeller protein
VTKRFLVFLCVLWLVGGCSRRSTPTSDRVATRMVVVEVATAAITPDAPTIATTSLPAAISTSAQAGSDIPSPPRVLARVSLNESFPSAPQAVAVDATSGDLYVVGEGGHDLPGWLAVVRGDAITGKVPVGAEPESVAVHPRTGYVYVVNRGSDDVSIVSGTQVIATVDVGHRPNHVAVDPDTGTVYVSNTWGEPDDYARDEPGTVSIISGTRVIIQVLAGIAPQQIEVHPGNGLVYVRNHRETITVIDDAHVLADVPVGLPWSLAAMAIEPITGYVYVAGGASLAVIDGTELLTTLDLGGPAIDALAADFTTGYVYVAQQSRITVIDDLSVVATLPIEQMANHLACQPSTGHCYVAGLLGVGDTAMTVIQGTEILTSTWAGSYPHALLADPHRERMILASDGLTTFAGPRIVETIGASLGLSAAAAAADTGYLYLLVRPPRWPADRIMVVNGLERIASLPTRGFGSAVTVNPASGLAYVADRLHDKVRVISGTEVIATVGVGEVPSFVAANPATGLVYVVNASGSAPGLGAVDVLSGTEWLAWVPAGDYTGEVVANPATGYVYVANRGSPPDYLGSIDVLSGTRRLATLPAGRYPHALVVNPATGYVYASNRESEDITVYRELAQILTLSLSGPPQDACLDPTTGYVYVAEEGDRVAVVSGTQVLAELPVAPRPVAVAADPQRGYVFVLSEWTASGASHVTVLRGTEVVTEMVFAGDALSGLVVEPNTGLAYLFDSHNDDLVVIGLSTGP